MIRIPTAEQAGPILGDLRRMLRETQIRIAELCGVEASWLSSRECGRKGMTLASLIRLADALGYDLALIPREDA